MTVLPHECVAAKIYSLLQGLYFETRWAKEGRMSNNLKVEVAETGLVTICTHDSDSDSDF